MTTATAANVAAWQPLCNKSDLIPFSGVAAWVETAKGSAQIALFYLPGHGQEVYAIDNHDPFSGANVIARGIVGDIKGEPVVASPLYKQHFRLNNGSCVEDGTLQLRSWPVQLDGDRVMIAA